MATSKQDSAYVKKARELALSGKFNSYIEVEAAMVMLGYPSLVVEWPALADEIDALCKKTQRNSESKRPIEGLLLPPTRSGPSYSIRLRSLSLKRGLSCIEVK